jgi:uncharacterized protein YccT (UPF0319 family)
MFKNVRASILSLRASAHFHLLDLQGEWVKRNLYTSDPYIFVFQDAIKEGVFKITRIRCWRITTTVSPLPSYTDLPSGISVNANSCILMQANLKIFPL